MLLTLFWTFFKIGLFTFGGGYAMIPLISEYVVKNNWLNMDELIDFIAISESTPGPFALNIATFIGNRVDGIIGAICSTLGVVIPSFIIILIVAKFYVKYKDSRIVKGLMYGLRPASVALIASAFLTIFLNVFFPNGFNQDLLNWYSIVFNVIVLAIISFMGYKKLHPVFLLVISAALGIAGGLIQEIII